VPTQLARDRSAQLGQARIRRVELTIAAIDASLRAIEQRLGRIEIAHALTEVDAARHLVDDERQRSQQIALVEVRTARRRGAEGGVERRLWSGSHGAAE